MSLSPCFYFPLLRQTRETCEAHFEKRFTESRFPLHVKLVMANLDRRRRLVLFKAARKIQLVARDYLDLQYVRQARAKVAALKCLRRMFKACLLRLAVYRKVIAKRAKKEVRGWNIEDAYVVCFGESFVSLF